MIQETGVEQTRRSRAVCYRRRCTLARLIKRIDRGDGRKYNYGVKIVSRCAAIKIS